MNKAWSGLEKAPPGSFKNKIHGLGLSLLSRVKPSEIFLKSIPKQLTGVEVVFPSSLNARLVRRRLRHIALRGTVVHKNYFYGSVTLLPVTSAFAVLPLPNVPFFWILFRTYSHWRALKGSEKLLQLVSDSPKNQKSSEIHPENEAAENNSEDPPLVMQASEELERLVGGGDDVSKCRLTDICKVFDLNTVDVLKYQQQQQKNVFFSGDSIRYHTMPTDIEDEIKDEKNPRPLDEDDIALLKTYGLGPYSTSIKKAEKDVKEMARRINDLCVSPILIGIKESDTGLAAPSQWDLVSDKQMMQEEQPLQVARCTKIINPNTEDAKYVINVKQIAKFVVGLGDKVSPTDIEEGMRVGVDRNKYQIQIPLPPKIDPSVTMMTVEEKPDVTYNDVGGCKEQIEKMREVVELPMLHPEKFVKLGIDPPKGVLCYGPPGTGKTLLARAVANRTDACFIRVIGSELVQKYVGEGARMVRELFQMARSKKACIVFFDEVDAIGGARFDDGVGGDNEVQRTMLEIVNQLDGFDARGNIKVLMATNRPDTLDPALLRPGRLDRKVEFGLPDMESRTQIFKIHTRTMNCERDVRFELLARLCPNSTGADIRSVCTEAGMYAIRARRKTVTEKDFLDAVNKVIKGYQKFSATPKYMVYN
ncbi:26S proteasome subunit P45 [Cynara cardunculus var. scolymus]|uniref:26S proteasome subunit P45 n=1 Tax=Cynara cardunculus var. scolymus TaxID=59895 RepID=A0A103XLE4_CYNCS|nr:26S proteasome subunit P45 [Cynara cardunculus var. scolymus]